KVLIEAPPSKILSKKVLAHIEKRFTTSASDYSQLIRFINCALHLKRQSLLSSKDISDNFIFIVIVMTYESYN
ncbi:157_t:CDS:1, partial [Paraglomus occultum]